MENNKSAETLLWDEVIKEVINYYKNSELIKSGKMIAEYKKSDLIKNLKHQFFIDKMKHNKD